jgi:hypothetical protein
MSLPLTVGQPEEELALFNPAFIAVLLHNSTRGYTRRTSSKPFPVAFAYLVTPLALHQPTRQQLPITVATQMAVWTQGNPLLLADLPSRVRALRPLVSDACCLALRHGVLTSDSDGLLPSRLRRRIKAVSLTRDGEDCLAHGSFLGRWFAGQPDVATALAMWGLRP